MTVPFQHLLEWPDHVPVPFNTVEVAGSHDRMEITVIYHLKQWHRTIRSPSQRNHIQTVMCRPWKETNCTTDWYCPQTDQNSTCVVRTLEEFWFVPCRLPAIPPLITSWMQTYYGSPEGPADGTWLTAGPEWWPVRRVPNKSDECSTLSGGISTVYMVLVNARGDVTGFHIRLSPMLNIYSPFTMGTWFIAKKNRKIT